MATHFSTGEQRILTEVWEAGVPGGTWQLHVSQDWELAITGAWSWYNDRPNIGTLARKQSSPACARDDLRQLMLACRQRWFGLP